MDPLKVLTEVVKAQSFTKAAENLYTSQPSISRDIKRLENDYNVKVFEFKHSKMTLTSDGEKLYQYALQRNYLEQALRQDLKMQNNAVAGDLKLGSSFTFGEYRLSRQLTKLAQMYSELHIHVHLDNSETIVEQIKNNIVDVGIVEKKIQNNAIISTPTAQDEIVLIKKKSSSSNLETCFIREQGSGTRVYQENGLNQLSLNPYLVVINNTSLIKSMVHAGNGFSIVSKSTLTSEDLEQLEVINLDIERFFYLILHKDKYIDEKMKRVISVLKQNME